MSAESVPDPHMGGLRQTQRPERDDRAPDAAVAELAQRQQGVVARRQLLDMGMGRRAIEHRLSSGRLHRLQNGVYAVGHRLVSAEGWWMAAVLASGPQAVLTHRSAATLWGLRGQTGGASHVTVPRKSSSSKDIRRHVSRVAADERTVEQGIPVTTVPRTILDLAATETADVIDALLRESEYLRLYDPLSLLDLVDRYPGRRGIRTVRAALARLELVPPGRIRNRLEERFGAFVRRYRLPQPRFNDWIFVGAKRFQVDCHWPGTGQIVELDGWEGHGTRSSFRGDRARDRVLRVAGYSVTRVAWAQLDDEPEAIARDLGSLLTGTNYKRT